MTTILHIRTLFKHSFPALLGLWLISSPVIAHTGQNTADGIWAGVLHPVMGADHLSTALTVALWALQLGGRALLLLPAGFILGMTLGAWSGLEALLIPGIESGILFSVLILGLLVTTRKKMPVSASFALVMMFALLHGHAHGFEAPPDMHGWSYIAGILLGTLGLHLTGLGLGSLMGKWLGGRSLQLLGMALLVYGTS